MCLWTNSAFWLPLQPEQVGTRSRTCSSGNSLQRPRGTAALLRRAHADATPPPPPGCACVAFAVFVCRPALELNVWLRLSFPCSISEPTFHQDGVLSFLLFAHPLPFESPAHTWDAWRRLLFPRGGHVSDPEQKHCRTQSCLSGWVVVSVLLRALIFKDIWHNSVCVCVRARHSVCLHWCPKTKLTLMHSWVQRLGHILEGFRANTSRHLFFCFQRCRVSGRKTEL